MTSNTKLFLSLPLAILGTFAASALIGMLVMERFNCWTELIVGPFCATTVMAVTFWLAPSRQSVCGMIVLVLGVSFAWWLLRDRYYPEWHAKAYQPTSKPLVVTVCAGVVNYLLWWLIWREKGRAERRGGADE